MANEPDQLVISGLSLAHTGVGLGVYTYRLITGLLRKAPDLRFRVVVPGRLSVPEQIPERVLIRLHGHEFRNPLLNGIYWSNRILSYAGRLSLDTIFHSPIPIAGFGRARTTVVTIHDCLYRTLPRYFGALGIRRRYLLATERYAARSQLVLTQSEFTQRDIAMRTPIAAAKIQVLSPWVDCSFLDDSEPAASADRVRVKLGLPKRFWLYLGGYDYRKNLEFLIQCYAHVRRGKIVPPLVLAGHIPPRRSELICNVLGTLNECGLQSEDVLMPGFIDIVDLPAVYRAASLLIYPSLLEGFGLPPAEAMAVGTPVLASNTSSLPEVVRNPDCLFDPTDRESLVEKLRLAADNETRFVAQLSETYSESYGIRRYLSLLGQLRPTHGAPLLTPT